MSQDPEAELVKRARAGDKLALADLLRNSQQLVYRLAVRMVPDPIEAQDLTQAILIRVVTGLEKFRGESSFKTWVYRVASNHLLTARKRLAEHHVESLDAMAEKLADGIADGLAAGDRPSDDRVLIKRSDADVHEPDVARARPRSLRVVTRSPYQRARADVVA